MSPTRQTNNVPKWVILSLQVRVFYAVRIFLGILSVITDAALVVALSRKYGKRLACYALAMLCLTSGCFFASTSEYAYSLCYGYPHLLALCGCRIRQGIFVGTSDHFFQYGSCSSSCHYKFLFICWPLISTLNLLFFCRFFAKFILDVCHISLVCIVSLWETCHGCCSCSRGGNSWLAILSFGFSANNDLLIDKKVQTVISCRCHHVNCGAGNFFHQPVLFPRSSCPCFCNESLWEFINHFKSHSTMF